MHSPHRNAILTAAVCSVTVLSRSGYLSKNEIKSSLKNWKVPCSEHRLNKLFEQFDWNRDGKIHYGEFVEALTKDAPLLKKMSLGMKWE